MSTLMLWVCTKEVMLTVSLINLYLGLLDGEWCHEPVVQPDALTASDQNHVAVRVVTSAEEHPLTATNSVGIYQA
jgi:hypothetical protein